jgi:hypothetical protein
MFIYSIKLEYLPFARYRETSYKLRAKNFTEATLKAEKLATKEPARRLISVEEVGKESFVSLKQLEV